MLTLSSFTVDSSLAFIVNVLFVEKFAFSFFVISANRETEEHDEVGRAKYFIRDEFLVSFVC